MAHTAGTTSVFRTGLLIGTSMLAAPLTAQTASPGVPSTTVAQSASDADRETIQDIVVTAQRRDESLQRVPVAVSAFTSENVRVQRIANPRDLNALAPGLSVNASPGGTQSATFTLRGIFSSPAFAGQNGGVSLYIDGVYLSANVGQFFELADIERIEVLRGPQGTLFGRNATGGAISITTKAPTGEFGVRSENSYGNYDHFRTKTRVDLPAWGPLSVSATYLHSERRGDIRNIGAGTQWDYGPGTNGNYGIRTSPKFLGDHNTDAFVISALLEPVDGVRIAYKYDNTQEDYTDNGQGLAGFGFGGVGTSAFTIGAAQALYAAQPAALRTQIGLKRPDAVNNSFTTPANLKTSGHTFTASWEVSDSLSIKDIAAYRQTRVLGTTNVDGFGFAGLVTPSIPVAPGVSLPIGFLLGGGPILGTLIGVSTNSKQHQFSNELQATYTSDFVDLTGGLLYFYEHSSSIPFFNNAPFRTGLLSGIFYAAAPFTPGQPIVLLNGPVFNPIRPGGLGISQSFQASTVYSRSKAVYAQATFHLSEQLDAQLGGRWTWDKKRGIDALSSNGRPILADNLRYKNDRPTWLVGLNYQATPDILTYAKVSTGFITGGQLGGFVYRDEKATSYEAGVKADLLDDQARVNLAVYHADYEGVQSASTVSDPTGQTVNAILNYGDARARGVELEATLIPFQGVTLNGNLGFTDFKLKRSTIDARAVAGLNTQAYALVAAFRPKWTASVNAQYQSPEASWGGRFLLRGEANYKGRYWSSPRGYDDNSDGKFNSSDQTYDIIRHPTQWLFNARAAITQIPLGPVKAEIALWGRNLSNNRQNQFVSWLGFGYSESFERARTYGVDLTIDF